MYMQYLLNIFHLCCVCVILMLHINYIYITCFLHTPLLQRYYKDAHVYVYIIQLYNYKTYYIAHIYTF